jgi:hypothetical protein
LLNSRAIQRFVIGQALSPKKLEQNSIVRLNPVDRNTSALSLAEAALPLSGGERHDAHLPCRGCRGSPKFALATALRTFQTRRADGCRKLNEQCSHSDATVERVSRGHNGGRKGQAGKLPSV